MVVTRMFVCPMIMAIVVVTRIFGGMIVSVMASMSVCRVFHQCHELFALDFRPDTSFDLFCVQQEIAERLVSHGEHP